MRPGGGPARHQKKIVINEGDHEETGGFIICAWSDCERPGYASYVIRRNEGAPRHPRIVRYAFCSERHLYYFSYSHVSDGSLPPGMRKLPR